MPHLYTCYISCFNPEICTTSNYYDEDQITGIPNSNLQRMHRFEIYLKRNPKSNKALPIYFDIQLSTKSDEVLFEVNLCPKIGEHIPDFCLPDKILASNLYNDGEALVIPNVTTMNSEIKLW